MVKKIGLIEKDKLVPIHTKTNIEIRDLIQEREDEVAILRGDIEVLKQFLKDRYKEED